MENEKFAEIHAWGGREYQFSRNAWQILDMNVWNTILKRRKVIKLKKKKISIFGWTKTIAFKCKTTQNFCLPTGKYGVHWYLWH